MGGEPDQGHPFRFYDNRQKYLTFVNTCEEKWRVAERAAAELAGLAPEPPALRMFDAGVGDGTVLAHLLRSMHARFPTIPFYVVGKEISLEDVRLTLEKIPDRLIEHPQTVIVLTNLHYAEAPSMTPNTAAKREQLVVERVQLDGDTSHALGAQLRGLDRFLADHWAVSPSERTGNPIYVTPTALVIHRKDQAFALDHILPDVTAPRADYDFVLASQPWRSRMSADFKVRRILAPLARSLRPGGVLLGIQSSGADPGTEIVQRIWPGEAPFPVGRHELITGLRDELDDEVGRFEFVESSDDDDARLTYRMHTLPTELGNRIGTSTLFAAWNAAIYVAQIDDDRVEQATLDGEYLGVTSEVLREHGGLWFHDESFVIRRLD